VAGTPLQQFTVLAESQGPAWATGAEVLINEGAKNSYFWQRINKGKSMLDLIQGGDQIQDRIFFDAETTFERVDPQFTVVQYENLQTGTNWTANWSFAFAYLSWNNKERGLNNENFKGSYRRQMFKSVLFQKHQNLWTDICNNIDDEFFSTPNQERMEAATTTGGPRIPYSLPVFINEMSDGNGTQGSGVDGLPDATAGSTWTVVMGINPTTQTKWQNQRELYTFASTTALTAAAIFAPMSRLMRRLRFDRLPMKPEYSDKSTSPHVIMTQGLGLDNYEYALRTNQDEFRGVGKMSGQDPAYDRPTFRNIPLDYSSGLDTAAIYPTGASNAFAAFSSTANDGAAANGVGFSGPRYYFINGEYMKLVFHRDYYARLGTPFMPSQQPDSRVQVCEIWNQFYTSSRLRHGILAPSAAITSV
jgi:hypothetical protein